MLLAAFYFGATAWIARQMSDPIYELMLKALHLPAFIASSFLPGPVFGKTIGLFVLADCILWGFGIAWAIRWLWRTLSRRRTEADR